MNKYIKRFIGEILDFKTDEEYIFQNVCGLTFVFRRDITTLNDQITSGEINPVGIIYEENDEFYYAPLHGNDEITDIVKEFVKKEFQ